jgi:hypothetical protein
MLAAMASMRWPGVMSVILIGCGGAAQKPAAGGDQAMVAGGTTGAPRVLAFTELEERLIGERAVEVEFEIHAEGAHTAAVKGDLRMVRDNHARWRVSGTFDGNPISIDQIFDPTAGGELSRAIVIGWMRMGLLHNIATMVQGQGIEHATGGIAEWIEVDEIGVTDDSISIALGFADGKGPTGTARIEVDGLGLPEVRTQTVKFPDGEMRVE